MPCRHSDEMPPCRRWVSTRGAGAAYRDVADLARRARRPLSDGVAASAGAHCHTSTQPPRLGAHTAFSTGFPSPPLAAHSVIRPVSVYHINVARFHNPSLITLFTKLFKSLLVFQVICVGTALLAIFVTKHVTTVVRVLPRLLTNSLTTMHSW